MNKIIILILFFINTNQCSSQTYYPYQDIPLEKSSDYTYAEPMALSAATYILSTPFSKNDKNRMHALDFITKWMTGTKDYHFYLQDVAQNILEDPDLFGLYSAAMLKFCLENKSISSNLKLVRSSAYKLVLDYCDNPANNYKLRKKVRKELTNN